MRKRERLPSSFSLLLLVALALSSIPSTVDARHNGNRGETSTCDSDGFFDSTFCGLAKTVKSPANCARLAKFSDIACPTQKAVCNRSFNFTKHCADNHGGCPQDCERYLDTCCEVECCQDSCLDPQILCSVMELATCQDAKMEACPCKSDNRTATEYCTALVGDARCTDTCLAFYADCCNVLPGHVRITHAYTYPSADGDRITGRLEIHTDGKWGAICDDNFGDLDARVACRQLGYYDKSK